jgi:hypothetical protein
MFLLLYQRPKADEENGQENKRNVKAKGDTHKNEKNVSNAGDVSHKSERSTFEVGFLPLVKFFY